MEEEVKVHHVVLEGCKFVPEVSIATDVEFFRIRSINIEQHMSLLDAHLFDFQSLVIWQGAYTLLFVLLLVGPPPCFSHYVKSVQVIEED